MHPYATDSDHTPALYAWISLISIVSAYLLYIVLKATGLSDTLWFIDIPSVPGFIFIYYRLYDHKIWNKPIAKTAGVNSTPDLTGSWTGEIQSSHDAFTSNHAATLTIEQTASHISLVLTTERSRSESCLAMIFTKAPDGATIQYAYENKPSNSAVATMHAHEGAATLTLSSTGDTLSLGGHYYTGRDRENQGTMTFTKVQ